MNPSTIVHGLRSMKRLKRAIDEGFTEETNAMRIGTGNHALLLEPEEFENRFVVVPDFHFDVANLRAAKRKDEPIEDRRTDSRATSYVKQKVAEFAAMNRGKSFIGESEYQSCLRSIESIRSRPAMRQLVDSSSKEVTVLGEIQGVEFKGRIDLLNAETICDLKNTANVEKRAFGRVFANLKYAFKLSIYRELVRQSTGRILEVSIICQELSGDFDNTLVPVPSIVLDDAYDQVQQVVSKYRDAEENDYWPGVDGGQDYYELYVPQWAMEDNEDVALDWSGVDDAV
jgi:hypothetical protein